MYTVNNVDVIIRERIKEKKNVYILYNSEQSVVYNLHVVDEYAMEIWKGEMSWKEKIVTIRTSRFISKFLSYRV